MSSSSYVTLPDVGIPAPSRLGHTFPPYDIASAKAVGQFLDLNHQTYHVFFNEKNFHNHFAHHLLAAFQLGAGPSEYPRIYEHNQNDLDPAWKLNRRPTEADGIEKINDSNWTQHLGNRKYYWTYLEYFDHKIREIGLGAALQHYVFSAEANEGDRQMLGRFVGGAVHPLIHCGYAAEFNLAGILAEGLSMAAITGPRFGGLFPPGWDSALDQIASRADGHDAAKRLLTLQLTDTSVPAAADGATASRPRAGLSAFSICSLVLNDDRLAPGVLVRHDMDDKFPKVLEGEGAKLVGEYSSKWQVTDEDLQDPSPITGRGGWNEKWEELVWLNTLLLGATSKPGHPVRHDFFLMHTHNATLFMPALLPLLSLPTRARLLHSLFRLTLAIWLARGRASFHIADTLYKSSATPLDPGKKISITDPKGDPLVSPKDRNPWFDVIEAAVNHGDEHAMKALRAQIHFGSRFSSVKPGDLSLQPEVLARTPTESNTGFEGLELLDGTAFIRTAAQLLESQGWRSDGGFHWDFNGPGFPETWQDDAATGRQ